MTDPEPTPEELTKATEQRLRTLPPGHGLIVRVSPNWPLADVGDLHRCLIALAYDINPGCRVIVIPADEIQTCSWPGDPADGA